MNNPKLMQQLSSDLPLFIKNLTAAEDFRKAPPAPGCPPTATDMASFAALRQYFAGALGGMPPEAEPRQTFQAKPDGSVGGPRSQPFVASELFAGVQRFSQPLTVPVLAIYAQPHGHGVCKTNPQPAPPPDPELSNVQQADAFQKANPSAKVIRIPNAFHYVFISNEREVLRDIQLFLGRVH